MPVTLDDIATSVGVSRVTVSRALNGTGRMADATRQRVIETARKLNYRPNAVARATRTGRIGCVALLMSSEIKRSHLLGNTMRTLHDCLAKAHYHLNVTYLPDEQLDDAELVPKVLREQLAEGLLINYSEEAPEYLRQHVAASDDPALWINVKRPADAVHPDDYAAGRTLTRKMLEAGHTRVAYVDFSHDMSKPGLHYSALDRYAGYCDAMRSAGLAPRRVGDRRLRTHDLYERCRALLGGPDRPTALVSYSQTPAVLATAMQLGLDLPRDLSYATVADAVITQWPVAITSCITQADRYGSEIGNMMLQKLQSPQTVLPTRTVPFKFYPGESIARL